VSIFRLRLGCLHEQKKVSSNAPEYVFICESSPESCWLTARSLQPSQGEQIEPKKPRRSQRNQSPTHDVGTPLKEGQLPSPLTHKDSTVTDTFKDGTATPPSQARPTGGLSSPPSDTQPFSQFIYPPQVQSYAVHDEEAEGVWGYLVPLDHRSGDVLVLRRRAACPVPEGKVANASGKDHVPRKALKKQEEGYEKEKQKKGVVAGGYLIGRHPECG